MRASRPQGLFSPPTVLLHVSERRSTLTGCFCFQILQVEVNRHGTSVEALNEMFHSQKKKQKESKLKQLNKLWVEVVERSDKRKEELKSVFIMIAKDFERWELGMIKRLDSGELVTSDILVFEEKLQVIGTRFYYCEFSFILSSENVKVHYSVFPL